MAFRWYTLALARMGIDPSSWAALNYGPQLTRFTIPMLMTKYP